MDAALSSTAETSTPILADAVMAAPAPFRTRYACSAVWENSQYDDSDWLQVCYFPDTDTLERVLDGTTRCAAGTMGLAMADPMTDEIRPRALAALVRIYLDAITHREEQRVLLPEPNDLAVGARVRFLEDRKCMVKSETHNPCARCAGSGRWENPKREGDTRTCFTCRGDGIFVTREKVARKDAEWQVVSARSTGVVLGVKSFGKFYKRGHNVPDRGNTTVYVLLDNGRIVQAPLAKLRLDRDMETAETLMERAVVATDGGSSHAFYLPFATNNVSLL